jgi:hypothetical protein
LDYVIHINNGSETVKPIVLRLLPGEETIFNLKVINHGEPSNISLEASDPVFKAVRLKKRDRYVVMEETVPIMARMPADTARLDGEILLTSSAGESKVPISLLREPEDPGDDLEESGVIGDPDLKDDLDNDLENDLSDLAKEGDGDESEDKDEEGEDAEDGDNFEEIEQNRRPDDEEDERDVRRIEFSRDRDLQRYKSASRPANMGGNPEEWSKERSEASIERRVDGKIEGHIEEQAALPTSPSGYQEDHQGLRQDPGYGTREYTFPSEAAPEMADEEERYREQEGIFNNFEGWGTLQVIPAVIFLILISVLVLTFITESIPVFPGALASSILIVTLIIYGAATLLKA